MVFDLCKNEACKVTLVVLFSALLFFYILTLDLSGFMKGILAVLVLLLTGIAIRKITDADGWTGFVMLRIKEGLGFISWANRNFGKWMDLIADFGMVFGFGLLSLKMFKHIDRKTLIFSLAILLIFFLFISPYISLIALTTMQIPQQESGERSVGLAYLSLALILITGFVGVISLGLVAKAVEIIVSVFMFLFGSSPSLNSSPGVSFIIPGITIPLFEGIIALLILLIVHEGAHGIESIRSKVRLKSTGLLLFGFIPVGAFVDVDDKEISKKKIQNRLRISAAGPGSNLMIMLLFFVPTMILLFMLPSFYSNNVIIAGFTKNLDGFNVTANTIIYSINGIKINSISDFNDVKGSFSPNSSVILETDKGEFTVKTDENGKIGIIVSQTIKDEYRWLYSIYLIFALSTVLNFFVGVLNLLPVQAFDGYRLVSDSIKDKRIVDAVAYVLLFSLLINLLPWVWH